MEMKYIIAIIQPHKLEEVKKALEDVEIGQMTVSNVLGHGRQKGATQIYRGSREAGCLLKKIKIEIACNAEHAQPVIDALTQSARTGEVGDGKIFVLDLHDALRIRTGESGVQAIA
jgi:nitrogen regulatory protein P-II 2